MKTLVLGIVGGVATYFVVKAIDKSNLPSKISDAAKNLGTKIKGSFSKKKES